MCQGFFCSELVGDAWKTLGVLPSEHPASGYWPVDFGASQKLPLHEASLGEELSIDFR